MISVSKGLPLDDTLQTIRFPLGLHSKVENSIRMLIMPFVFKTFRIQKVGKYSNKNNVKTKFIMLFT